MSIQIKGATYQTRSPEEHIRGISLLLPIQDRKGFVFLTAYTKKEDGNSELLLQTLMDQGRRLAESFGKESNPQHRFEQFLGALNETLAQHVRQGHWKIPIEQVHAIVGIASPTEMYFSGTGELVALFLHKKPSGRYQVFNLFRSLQTEQSLPTWEKLFAVVLDGDLHPGDVFCISDKDIQRTIEIDDLNHILASLPPISAVEKIRQYFSHKENILLTVLKINDGVPSLTEQTHSTAVPKSNVSVEELNFTQETTDRLLDDQRPSFSILLKKIQTFIRSKTDRRSRLLTELHPQGGTHVLFKRLVKLTWKTILLIAKYTRQHTWQVFHAMKNREQRQRIHTRLNIGQRQVRGRFHTFVGSIQNVPRSTKFLLGGIGIAIVILVFGISIISSSQARAENEKLYLDQLTIIDDVMERAAGALIYKDETQARSLYVNAQTLIESLPIDTPERTEHAQKLAQNLQVALNEIRHVVTIPNPPLLADLETLTDGVFGNALVLASETLYVAGSDSRLYQFNRNEKQFDVAALASAESSPAVAASQEDGRTYLLAVDGNVYSVLFENQLLSPLSIQDDRWVDLDAYANRLYLLRPGIDTTDGQIIRYQRNGSDFENETEWITSRTVSLVTARSLTIDGNVYVLMQDGSVSRFANGSEEGWRVEVVDPHISDATKIWTDTESDYLYVLEPATQRLIVFAKESGEFITQYRSDAFQDLTDFMVDEEGYTIYLLAGSKLYSIAPSHLK